MSRVALVDDDAECAAACASELRKSGWVVELFARAALLLARARSAPPFVLMDLGLPGEDAIAAIDTLHRESPGSAIVVLTGRGGEAPVFRALRAGAVGFVLKNDAVGHLAEVLDEVRRGGAPMSPSIARRVIEAFHAPPRENDLTDREREVINLLARGHSYGDAAKELGVALDTVRTHVRRAYEKLHATTKGEAIARAFRAGLIE
jgi:DNA-binding NarL/FixJ family response regulator